MILRTPTDVELSAYFDLRWRMLRQPWHQPPGSERDDMEAHAVHLAAWSDSGKMMGVARLHSLSAEKGQIRYMAVDSCYRGGGVGTALLRELERCAAARGLKELMLNARGEAVRFYRKGGYQLSGPAPALFGVIPHWTMRKHLASAELEKNVPNRN